MNIAEFHFGMCWPHSHTDRLYQPHTDHILTMYHPHTDRLYQPHTDRLTNHIPTTYQPHTDQILTMYRPHTDRSTCSQLPSWNTRDSDCNLWYFFTLFCLLVVTGSAINSNQPLFITISVTEADWCRCHSHYNVLNNNTVYCSLTTVEQVHMRTLFVNLIKPTLILQVPWLITTMELHCLLSWLTNWCINWVLMRVMDAVKETIL